MELEVTGFCWNCGRACDGLFCDPRCRLRHERKAAIQENRQTRKGKRAGYGAAGSTH